MRDGNQDGLTARGMDVRSVSGRRIGTVARTWGDAFEVALAEDWVWLGPDAIFTRGGGQVTLICESDGVARYRVVPPPGAPPRPRV